MNEKLFWVKVADQEYPLLYNLAANADFDEHYMDVVEDVDDLMNYFIGPQDAKGDTPEELQRKAKERKQATVYFKRELPWLISTLARHGLKAAEKAGEPDLPKAPTELQLSENAWPGQQAAMIGAVNRAILYGRLLTHQNGESKEVDVVLRELEAKNMRGAAG